MAHVIPGTPIEVDIDQTGGHGTNSSCYALPGYNLPSTYLDVHWHVKVEVTTDYDVLLTFSGSVHGNNIYGSSFPSKLYVGTEYFEITAKSGYIEVSRGDAVPATNNSEDFIVTKSSDAGGPLDWSFDPPITINIGKLSNFHWSEADQLDQTGYVWVCASAYYDDITSEIPVGAIRISLPGLKTYLEYFPGMIFQSSWSDALSCNHSGGYFKQNRNFWADRKNKPGTDPNNGSTVFLHNGTDFNLIAPRIGIQ